MSIRRWDPFDELTSLRESMERLFDDFFTRRPAGRPLAPAMWEPAVEVFETEGEVVFRAEMPGIDPQSVDVTVSEDSLTLKAEARAEAEQKGRNYYRRELRYGAFQRSVALPTSVQTDQAKAAFKNGILEVRIPKAERAKAKTVRVEVE
ncbi:MAG: Hsp20/alpha crystallin family protein [Armatimonadetes bacterium]|nr:Hsp20/alpha crystallin family protein [Armatimonadota bacterium]